MFFVFMYCSVLSKDLVALSLCGNKLENKEEIVQEVTKFKNLKALWLNNNPVLEKRFFLVGIS